MFTRDAGNKVCISPDKHSIHELVQWNIAMWIKRPVYVYVQYNLPVLLFNDTL